MTNNHQLDSQAMRKQVYEALKLWSKDIVTENPLSNLKLSKAAQQAQAGDIQRILHTVLDRGLQVLSSDDPLEAKILRLHFQKGELVQNIAAQLNLAEGTTYNKQSGAIDHLAKILYGMEMRIEHRCTQLQRLNPPSYLHLVGVDEHLTHLVDLLCAPTASWLVAIAGMGGMGKTSLADALMRRIIELDVYDDVGWITAQQQQFSLGGRIRDVEQPALSIEALVRALIEQLMPDVPIVESASADELLAILGTKLQEQPHLIVIDNLETLVDIESLVATLRTLANPTRFLLTSRESLFSEPDVYHFPLPELTETLTLALVRQEAKQRNLHHLLAASDTALQPIVETVGGNPLAIRLVVGQTHVHSLDMILENLRSARGQKIENLYTYIYRQAWDALDEIARRTLLVMPLVSSVGGTLAHIQKVSQLDLSDLIEALEHLVRVNLVDSRGDLNERRYAIHNLTTTFLHEQVIRWGVAAD
ncbi:ATP-binding protein [Chloroflexi bacterium TSY]|nr:ATP-binding protein [Chloroflexi bacterium TSY]